MSHKPVTEVKLGLVGENADVEFSVLLSGTPRRTIQSPFISRLSLPRLYGLCEIRSALLRVDDCFIKPWFKFQILRLLTALKGEPNSVLIAIARVEKIDWDALVSHDRFLFADDKGTIIAI